MTKPQYPNLVGNRYGRWVVLAYGHMRRHLRYWICRCDCGTERPVIGTALTKGNSMSCGCGRLERVRERVTIHGHAKDGKMSSEYRSWSHMRRRCLLDPSYTSRGITVSDEWERSFVSFLADMGSKPSAKHSIERVDNDKGYSKDNCVWATAREQINNRRTTKFVMFQGRRMPISDACREAGIKYDTVKARQKRGWPEECLFLPRWGRDCHLLKTVA